MQNITLWASTCNASEVKTVWRYINSIIIIIINVAFWTEFVISDLSSVEQLGTKFRTDAVKNQKKITFQDVEAWIPFQSNILITTESDPAHEQFMQFEAEISELNANIIRGASAVRYRWWLF